MHNKFFVLTKDNKPIAVWTGSTNLTENGIFGHSNCAHVIEDPRCSRAYLAYWNELNSNPDSATEKALDGAEKSHVRQIPGLRIWIRYFHHARDLKCFSGMRISQTSPQKPLFMTFAFGMHKYFPKSI